MRLGRRNFLGLAAGAAMLPALPRVARAQVYPSQVYPSRPVHIVVGFAAGGAADTVARLAAQWLSQRFDQQFIVENRPGAATNVATAEVVQAAPDGYTLLLVTASNAINATLYEHLDFNFLRDMAPISGVIRVPNVMEVNLEVPAATVAEFIAYDLPPASTVARICSYECTFCADCVDNVLFNVCPNCGGGFAPRPIRPANEWRPGLSLAQRPPSSKRVFPTYSRDDIAAHSRRLKDIPPEQR
jgi:hypothetical protein